MSYWDDYNYEYPDPEPPPEDPPVVEGGFRADLGLTVGANDDVFAPDILGSAPVVVDEDQTSAGWDLWGDDGFLDVNSSPAINTTAATNLTLRNDAAAVAASQPSGLQKLLNTLGNVAGKLLSGVSVGAGTGTGGTTPAAATAAQQAAAAAATQRNMNLLAVAAVVALGVYAIRRK